ncbi:hypothetical protein UY3_02399 [Chelonia mydas]|uniref:Uncharacterized protein n=1 Tax=Chelonia mydas TaxID=8469 RepID=M7C7A3_CHEMY|nr:hypothetical protein UY3_02399 [Chelonia mydas]
MGAAESDGQYIPQPALPWELQSTEPADMAGAGFPSRSSAVKSRLRTVALLVLEDGGILFMESDSEETQISLNGICGCSQVNDHKYMFAESVQFLLPGVFQCLFGCGGRGEPRRCRSPALYSSCVRREPFVFQWKNTGIPKVEEWCPVPSDSDPCLCKAVAAITRRLS